LKGKAMSPDEQTVSDAGVEDPVTATVAELPAVEAEAPEVEAEADAVVDQPVETDLAADLADKIDMNDSSF
jgi:hypothetical protein